MRILFLSRWYPWPPDNGSKLRIHNLLRGLARHHVVTLLTFVDGPAPDTGALASVCREVRTVRRKPFEPHSGRALAGFLSPLPRSVIDTWSPEMERQVRDAVAGRSFDVVIASQVDTAAYATCFDGLPALFEEIEVGVLYERFAAADSVVPRLRNRLTWMKQRRYLAKLLRHFRACTVVSEQERRLLLAEVPSAPNVEVLPNCVSLADYASVRESPRPGRLIFTGAFSFDPNYEAMAWFLREVYPRLEAEVPGVELLITGDHAGRVLPPGRNVILTGRVADVRPFVSSAWVSLAPIFTGGGTRLKILEAMALRTPVVATSKGAEGLEVEAGRHLLIADSPAEFAGAVTRVLNDPGLRAGLTDNAFELVSRKYEWSVILPRLLEMIERICRGDPPGRPPD